MSDTPESAAAKELRDILHILRNPYGHSQEEIRQVALAAAALLESRQEDAERLDWLGAHPRVAEAFIEGKKVDCYLYGVSCAPKWTVREAIDAAIAARKEQS